MNKNNIFLSKFCNSFSILTFINENFYIVKEINASICSFNTYFYYLIFKMMETTLISKLNKKIEINSILFFDKERKRYKTNLYL